MFGRTTERGGIVVQIIELIVMIMCYGMYFYNDIKKDHYNAIKKDHYNAIKFLMFGAIMQNLTLHLK